MSDLLPTFLTKEWLWANCSCCSLKKSDMSDSLMIWVNRSQKWAICLKVFHSFSSFLCPRAKRAIRSTKEGPWPNRSGHSWQKSYRSDSLFFTRESLFCSQKRSNSLKKPLSEFQTLCFLQTQSLTVTGWEKHSCLHVLYCTHRWITFYVAKISLTCFSTFAKFEDKFASLDEASSF